jgi:hypothetical protein
MARFKKGDRVKVVAAEGAWQGSYMGQVGVVIEDGSEAPFVRFDDGEEVAFVERKLELAPGTESASRFPTDAAERKAHPVCTGCLDYFPNALLEVAKVSKAGNEQHHPGEPLHWDKSKSTDEADALVRHLLQRGTIDTDGQRHSAKVAWRALALLERELTAGQP